MPAPSGTTAIPRRAARGRARCRGGRPLAPLRHRGHRDRAAQLAALAVHPARRRAARRHLYPESEPGRSGVGWRTTGSRPSWTVSRTSTPSPGGRTAAGVPAQMVFWADVRLDEADLAVLSLLGPAVGRPEVLAALGMDGCPRTRQRSRYRGGFARRLPSAQPGRIELDLLVPRADVDDWLARLTAAGVRRAGVWAYEAHQVAALRPRLGADTDDRTIPTRSAGSAPRCIWTRAATAARRPWRASTTWANRPDAGAATSRRVRGAAGHR